MKTSVNSLSSLQSNFRVLSVSEMFRLRGGEDVVNPDDKKPPEGQNPENDDLNIPDPIKK